MIRNLHGRLGLYCSIIVVFLCFSFTRTIGNQQEIAKTEVNNTKSQFKLNTGQWANDVICVSNINGINYILKSDGLYFDFYQADYSQKSTVSKKGQVVAIKFDNLVSKNDLIDQKVTNCNIYYLKNNISGQTPNSLLSNSILVKNIFSNVDLKLQILDGKPRYDFVVKPGADISKLNLKIEGANSINLNNLNELTFNTQLGQISNGNLIAYQIVNTKQKQIECKFEIKNENIVSFALGNYDRTKEIVIDPTVFASYFGGSDVEEITRVTIIDDFSFVVCGNTLSMDFNVTPGSYNAVYSALKDGFISKFTTKNGVTHLDFCTFIGGNADDFPTDILVNANKEIYVAGYTYSSDFPSKNSFLKTNQGASDGFVAKLSSKGDSLAFSILINGDKNEFIYDMYVNDGGDIFLCGSTNSTNFPKVGGLGSNAKKANLDVLILKIDRTLAQYDFTDFIGGALDDEAYAMYFDKVENIYITGYTKSSDFFMFPSGGSMMTGQKHPYDDSYNGGASDAFLCKLDKLGAAFSYSTFLGGSNEDVGKGVYAFDDGTAVIVGETIPEVGTKTFPTTTSALYPTAIGKRDGFIAKLDKQLTNSQKLLACSFFGSKGNDYVTGLDYNKKVSYLGVVGYTDGSDFPKLGTEVPSFNGNTDMYLLEIADDGGSINATNLLGGTGIDKANALQYDANGNYIIVGSTTSNNVKLPENTFQGTFGGGTTDGLITRVIRGNLGISDPAGGSTYCTKTNITISWFTNDLDINQGIVIELLDTITKKVVLISPAGGIVNSTSFTWTIPDTIPDGKNYIVRISHPIGISSKSPSTFEITRAPQVVSITNTTNKTTLCEGEEISLSGVVKGKGAEMQWLKDGQPINGQTNPTLSIKNVTAANAGSYSFQVTGFCNPSSNSSAVVFKVLPTTKVTNNQSNLEAFEKSGVTFTSTAIGDNLKYQWQHPCGTDIIGETNSQLVIAKLSLTDEGSYCCKVTGTCGIDSLKSFNLTVKPTSVFNEKPKSSDFVEILYSNENELKLRNNNIGLTTISLSIVDATGNIVKNLDSRNLMNKSSEESYNISDLSQGVYFLIVKSENKTQNLKFMIVK